MNHSIHKDSTFRTAARKWGLLPSDVEKIILKREWENLPNLKARLLGSRPFPIRLGLKPPAGRSAIANISHFQRFVDCWKSYPEQNYVEWEVRSYRTLSEQRVPRFFILNSIQNLIHFVGHKAKAKAKIWEANMAPLLTLPGDQIYPVLVKHLGTIKGMPLNECHLLTDLTQQLSASMGAGNYLRALPLVGVDTKFIENYDTLLSDLLDTIHDGALSKSGGLLNWLGCLENPKGWLCVRPLCDNAKEKMGGFPILKLSNDVLNQHELPAANILVVENIQSGLGLPYLPDTIAVFGGGKNIAWMNASWLKEKQVAYWGDIDTWGFTILNDVRAKLPGVTPLMMDMDTLRLFQDRMVIEPEPAENCPLLLNEPEKKLFFDLKSGSFGSSRLEQERLSSDYILQKLKEWVSSPT